MSQVRIAFLNRLRVMLPVVRARRSVCRLKAAPRDAAPRRRRRPAAAQAVRRAHGRAGGRRAPPPGRRPGVGAALASPNDHQGAFVESVQRAVAGERRVGVVVSGWSERSQSW